MKQWRIHSEPLQPDSSPVVGAPYAPRGLRASGYFSNGLAESIKFEASDLVKTTTLPFADMGYPFTGIRFAKSAGAVAYTIHVSAANSGGGVLMVLERPSGDMSRDMPSCSFLP